jgi:hypothetical protein
LWKTPSKWAITELQVMFSEKGINCELNVAITCQVGALCRCCSSLEGVQCILEDRSVVNRFVTSNWIWIDGHFTRIVNHLDVCRPAGGHETSHQH